MGTAVGLGTRRKMFLGGRDGTDRTDEAALAELVVAVVEAEFAAFVEMVELAGSAARVKSASLKCSGQMAMRSSSIGRS